MKIVNNFDFQKNQALNMLLHVLASAPASPVTGQVYYDSTLGQIQVYTGSAWGLKASDSNNLGGQNGAYYLSRANHTGTQLAATISDFASTVQTTRLDQLAAPTANVSFNSRNIINLLDPVNPQDAATKNYVDNAVSSAAAGIDSKASVKVVANTNQALTGTPTIDGVALSAGDRILLTAQTTASQNGVYVVAAGAWTRALDADATGEITAGAFWFVEQGTSFGASQWRCSNTGSITLGSTSITITQFGASVTYTAGNGITLGGNTISVVAKASGGLVSDGTGVYLDTTIAARKFASTIGNGALTTIAVTHNLGTQDVLVQARLVSTQEAVIVDWVATDANNVTFTFATAPAASSVRVMIAG